MTTATEKVNFLESYSKIRSVVRLLSTLVFPITPTFHDDGSPD